MTVVVIGDALIDEMRDERGSVDAPGGSALNVAVGLSILGVPAVLVAMYADDSEGQALSAHLDRYTVAHLVSPSALGTGRAVSDRSEGEPRYSFNAASVARAIDFTPPVRSAITDADLVAISGFPFDNQEQFDQLLDAVAGSTVLLDPNPRAGFMRDASLFASNLERFASSLRLLKIGEEDAQLLYGKSLDEVVGYFSPHTAVLATAGAAGATIYERGSALTRPIVHSTAPIVDTMGAGDATFASVIASLSQGEGDWSVILDRAMAIAAATIRHHGGVLRTS